MSIRWNASAREVIILMQGEMMIDRWNMQGRLFIVMQAERKVECWDASREQGRVLGCELKARSSVGMRVERKVECRDAS